MDPDHKYTSIVIDYGHGEDTPGKRYTFLPDGMECREYKTNRMTAALLIPKLLKAGFIVHDCVALRKWTLEDIKADWCWHSLEQQDISLYRRVMYCNSIPDSIVLSLHSNAVGYANKGPSQKARGGCMYTSPGQTKSDVLAEDLYSAFVAAFRSEPVFMQKGDTSDGDHDREARFYMLMKTWAPAVLGEMLFFVNREDADFLMSPHGQEVIAQAYFTGIAPHMRVRT